MDRGNLDLAVARLSRFRPAQRLNLLRALETEATLARVGKRVVLCAPIGAGKPVALINEFWRRAVADPSIDFTILTGLTLTTARYYTPFGRSLQRDYSAGSIYDYYTHGQDSPENADLDAPPKPVGSPVITTNVVFNNTGSDAYLVGYVDLDGDGDFTLIVYPSSRFGAGEFVQQPLEVA